MLGRICAIATRLTATLLLAFLVAVLTGVARFAAPAPAPVGWLDVLFIISASLTLALSVILLGRRMHISAEERRDSPASRVDERDA